MNSVGYCFARPKLARSSDEASESASTNFAVSDVADTVGHEIIDLGSLLGNFGFQRTVVAPGLSRPTIGERRSALVGAALAGMDDERAGKTTFASRKATVRSAAAVDAALTERL